MDESQRARAYTCISLRDLLLKCALALFMVWAAGRSLGLDLRTMLGASFGMFAAAVICRVEAATYGYGRRNRG